MSRSGWGDEDQSVHDMYPGIVHVFLARLQTSAKTIRANLINERVRV